MEDIKMSIVDAVGIPPYIGDVVVFAPPAKGAQEFIKGKIVAIHDKTVSIEHLAYGWDGFRRGMVPTKTLRKSKCFVIVKGENE